MAIRNNFHRPSFQIVSRSKNDDIAGQRIGKKVKYNDRERNTRVSEYFNYSVMEVAKRPLIAAPLSTNIILRDAKIWL